jgi:hypothetical protein
VCSGRTTRNSPSRSMTSSTAASQRTFTQAFSRRSSRSATDQARRWSRR